MPVETRYLRSDTHTINGLTARKLGTDLVGSVVTEIYRTAVATASADFGVRFFRRLADGTEVEIISTGTPIIVGTRTTLGAGLQSVNISVPEIALNPTDAIIVRCYYRNPATTGTWTQTGWTTPNWITPQLNALKLDAATWTVYLYTIVVPSETAGKYDIGLGFGSSTEPSRIENFTWTPVPAIVETIVAKDYPMNYLPTPVKAEQLTSKVSGATIIKVSQDYPLTLLKKGKAEELLSKWT